MPVGTKYVNPKKPNNAHNAPKFKNWASSYMIRRVIDPVRGETHIYPNESMFRFEGKDLDLKEPQGNPKWHEQGHKDPMIGDIIISNNYFGHHMANYEDRRNVTTRPIPTEMNYSPFQCPQIQLILRELAKFDKQSNRRDILDMMAQEIRYRQLEEHHRRKNKYHVAAAELKELKYKQSQGDQKAMHDAYLMTSGVSDISKSIGAVEKDPYKFINKAIDRIKPSIDFAILPTSPTQKIPVPKPINERRAIRFAVRWIHESAMLHDKNRKYCTTTGRLAGKDLRPMYLRYVDELYDAMDNTGYAYNKKLAHHKIAEAQKAYSQMFY